MKIINPDQRPWGHISHNPDIKKQVLLDSGEVPLITSLCRAVFRPGDKADAHSHQDMTEVFIISSGTGIIRFNNQQYPLHPAVVAVAEPDDVHEIVNTGHEDLVITYFGVKSGQVSSRS